MIFSEVQRRRSSSLLPIDYVGQSRDAISIKLPQDAGIEGIKPHYMIWLFSTHLYIQQYLSWLTSSDIVLLL